MACAEGIVFALVAAQEPAEAFAGSEFVKRGAVAPGQQLVHVSLVGDVENKAIFRCREDSVQGDGELDDAEIGPHMTAITRRGFNNGLPNFLRQLRELLGSELLHVRWGLNPFK